MDPQQQMIQALMSQQAQGGNQQPGMMGQMANNPAMHQMQGAGGLGGQQPMPPPSMMNTAPPISRPPMGGPMPMAPGVSGPGMRPPMGPPNQGGVMSPQMGQQAF